MKKHSILRRGGSDVLMEELIGAFSGGADFEFNPLFAMIHANLQARDSAHGGEEMLRLRLYEKLQRLVQIGGAVKSGGNYRGIPRLLAQLTDRIAVKHCRTLLIAVSHAVPED